MGTPDNDSMPGESSSREKSIGSRKFSIGIRGFPKQVYSMVMMSLVLALGRNIAFPYLWMYLAGKNGNGELQFDPPLVGFMIMIGGFSYILSLIVTGSLSDKFGRRKMMGASLFLQLFIVAGYAFAKAYSQFLLLHASYSFITALYDPALSAMVADLVQPTRREEVFGLNYMMTNAGVVVGSTAGGMILSANGYPILFLCAASFVITGLVILLLWIKESHPTGVKWIRQPRAAGILKDRLLILFCFMSFLTQLVYSQLSGLLSVYTESVGFPPGVYGILLSLNGIMPVILQIPIRKGAIRLGATRAFILAQALFSAGFGYFMFAKELPQFMFGVALLTLGEIIFFPTSSGYVANLAPQDMRGRYMSTSGLFSRTGSSIGPQMSFILYGMLVDKSLVWGFFGLIGFGTLPGYVALLKLDARRSKNHDEVSGHTPA